MCFRLRMRFESDFQDSQELKREENDLREQCSFRGGVLLRQISGSNPSSLRRKIGGDGGKHTATRSKVDLLSRRKQTLENS